MSVFDRLTRKRKTSTRQFTGISAIGDTLRTTQGELAFFKVSPTNMAVLSPEAAEAKIRQLTIVLSALRETELFCFDSAESFDANKNYLKRRIEEETVPAVRELLKLDLAHLDEIQITASTAREFVFISRLRKAGTEQMLHAVNRIEKTIKNQGFGVARLQKEDIKKLLMIYFERNVTSEKLPDIDGCALVETSSARDERSDSIEHQE